MTTPPVFVPSSREELIKLCNDVLDDMSNLINNNLELFESDQELKNDYAYIFDNVELDYVKLTKGELFDSKAEISLRHVLKDYLRLKMQVVDPIIN